MLNGMNIVAGEPPHPPFGLHWLEKKSVLKFVVLLFEIWKCPKDPEEHICMHI